MISIMIHKDMVDDKKFNEYKRFYVVTVSDIQDKTNKDYYNLIEYKSENRKPFLNFMNNNYTCLYTKYKTKVEKYYDFITEEY